MTRRVTSAVSSLRSGFDFSKLMYFFQISTCRAKEESEGVSVAVAFDARIAGKWAADLFRFLLRQRRRNGRQIAIQSFCRVLQLLGHAPRIHVVARSLQAHLLRYDWIDGVLELDVLLPQHLDADDRREHGLLIDAPHGRDLLVLGKAAGRLDAAQKLHIVIPDGERMQIHADFFQCKVIGLRQFLPGKEESSHSDRVAAINSVIGLLSLKIGHFRGNVAHL